MSPFPQIAEHYNIFADRPRITCLSNMENPQWERLSYTKYFFGSTIKGLESNEQYDPEENIHVSGKGSKRKSFQKTRKDVVHNKIKK